MVSHGHQALVQNLLNDLAQFEAATVTRVVLALNQPEAWQRLGGFDEAHFLCCKDANLCLRRAGLALAQVVQATQRAIHRRWESLRWHEQSLLRLWHLPAHRQGCQLLLAQDKVADTIGRS